MHTCQIGGEKGDNNNTSQKLMLFLTTMKRGLPATKIQSSNNKPELANALLQSFISYFLSLNFEICSCHDWTGRASIGKRIRTIMSIKAMSTIFWWIQLFVFSAGELEARHLLNPDSRRRLFQKSLVGHLQSNPFEDVRLR